MDLIRTPLWRCLRPASSATAPSASVSRPALPCRLPAYVAAAPSPQRDRRQRRGLRLPDAGAALRLDGRRSRASLAGEGEASAGRRPPRFLCLHGFRTSAEIMRRQVVGRWPGEVTSRLDLVFADGPSPAEGASPVAGVFDPPYYEWFQFVGEDFLKCRNLDRCFSYLEELMIREGPFDGLLGFSQGAAVSAVLAGLQEQGFALTGVAKMKCLIVIAGGKIQAPVAAARAFASKVMCPSLHFIGETKISCERANFVTNFCRDVKPSHVKFICSKHAVYLTHEYLCAGDEDFAKVHSEELVEAFVDPLVIRHPCGHTVPKLDDKGLQIMLTYVDKIEREIWEHPSTDTKIVVSNSEA